MSWGGGVSPSCRWNELKEGQSLAKAHSLRALGQDQAPAVTPRTAQLTWSYNNQITSALLYFWVYPFRCEFLASRALCFPGPSTQGLCSQPGWCVAPGKWRLASASPEAYKDAGPSKTTSGLVQNGLLPLPLAIELRMAAADWSKAKSTWDLPMVAPAETCCRMVLCYSGN